MQTLGPEQCIASGLGGTTMTMNVWLFNLKHVASIRIQWFAKSRSL